MRHLYSRIASFALAGVFGFLLSGCLLVHSHPHHGHHLPPGHMKKGIPPGHAKKALHYHGVGCGHVWRDGAWVSVEIGVGS